jgi:hypothetical protein
VTVPRDHVRARYPPRMIAFASVMITVQVSATSPVAGSDASAHMPAMKNGRPSGGGELGRLGWQKRAKNHANTEAAGDVTQTADFRADTHGTG